MLISQPVDTAYYCTHTLYYSIAIQGTPWIIVYTTTICNFISLCCWDGRVKSWVERCKAGCVFMVLD